CLLRTAVLGIGATKIDRQDLEDDPERAPLADVAPPLQDSDRRLVLPLLDVNEARRVIRNREVRKVTGALGYLPGLHRPSKGFADPPKRCKRQAESDSEVDSVERTRAH